MNRLLVLLAVAALGAAPAPAKPAAKKAAAATSVARGRVTSAELDKGSGKTKSGRLTLADDAGHLEQYLVDARTKTTCDGKKVASWEKQAMPGACERAVVTYESHTKRALTLELKSALKADADDVKAGRAAVNGEVAVTDALAGKVTVRMGGGSNLEFKVTDATKIVREAKGKPAEPIGLEAVKVGDRVEVHSRDWKTAEEIHVAP
ncbi:MAG: hypothetical protein HY079_05100 [Elusimicrobia bacterium]|nr:hypothetical protein [Elusimicrobiota bacterium]